MNRGSTVSVSVAQYQKEALKSTGLAIDMIFVILIISIKFATFLFVTLSIPGTDIFARFLIPDQMIHATQELAIESASRSDLLYSLAGQHVISAVCNVRSRDRGS